MRYRIYRGLWVLLALLLALGCFPVAAISPETGITLTLQMDNETAMYQGRALPLGEGTPAPYYSDNGAMMAPLRLLAQCLGGAVSWNAPTKEAALTRSGTRLEFTAGSFGCRVDGAAKVLSAPAEIRGGTLCVPVTAMTLLPGMFVHMVGYYDGGLTVITDHPLTQGDRSGKPNELYHAAAPDPDLADSRRDALAVLGPNPGLFDRTALLLRRDSRHAVVGGEAWGLCGQEGQTLPHQGDDGYLMVPLEACAQALGAAVTQDARGTAVTLGSRTAVFPPENGHLWVNGIRRENHNYGGRLENGTAYCSAAALAAGLGLFAYADGQSRGILLTPYNLTNHDDLQQRAWSAAQRLPLLADETAKGFLALTFDDGPSGPLTERLLDGLKARDARATFFLCGYRIPGYGSPMGRYLQEGHQLGNHSQSHAMLTALGRDRLAQELDAVNAAIEAEAGGRPTLMRPPGGAQNQTVRTALSQRGMSCVLWSVDPQDWKYHDKGRVVQSVVSQARDGDIILLHDMYATSVDAALEIIDTLQAQGYRFVTVSELASKRGVTLQPGAVYSQLP